MLKGCAPCFGTIPTQEVLPEKVELHFLLFFQTVWDPDAGSALSRPNYLEFAPVISTHGF